MWSPVATKPAPLARLNSAKALPIAVGSTPSTWTEAELLDRLLKSEPNSWRELNQRYARLVTSCIQRVVARFSKRVSVDAVEEIYATFSLKLLANDKLKLRSFEPSRGNKLGTWLGMLATHCAYDYLRSIRREPSAVCLTEAETLSSESHDPCESAMLSERAKLVRDLLADFSDKDRLFVTLYYQDGLSPEHVAERLGISVKTVYSKKHKIQRRLSEIVGAPAAMA
ncbi:MAG TPA: sigma-70 family RNA polymerase sigma factor [Polyangiaceae bacterium]|nr:sigma-70 family RNA polymerase sigma factor [Polyangiaceae bacterium]